MPLAHPILIAQLAATRGTGSANALGAQHDHANGWASWGAKTLDFPAESAAKLSTSELALDPAFVLVDDADQILAASNEPALLAAIGDRALDPVALAQDLLFGFMLGSRSRFDRVRRLLPGQKLHIDPSGRAQLTTANAESTRPDLATSRARVVAELAEQTANALGDDSASELSGGYDSRLALALAIRGGALPKLAFTLGTDDSPDVRSARAICAALKLEHHIIDPQPDVLTLVDDTRAFVTASGYCANATSYGWLPNVFRKLAPLRSRQLGGAGGEMATGFYYTGFDRLLDGLLGSRLHAKWVWYRLRLGGEQGSSLYANRNLLRQAAADAQSCLANTLASSKAGPAGDDAGRWRIATDRLYREQRLRQWAGPVLGASSQWYQPIAPLLSEIYLDWCRALPIDQRKRSTQLTLIRELSPQLADQPWAHDFAPAVPKWKRVLQRVTGARRGADLGAVTVAETLTGDPATRQGVDALARDESLGLDSQRVKQLMDSPSTAPREVGVLVSASLAHRAATDWAKVLSVTAT